MVLPAPPEQLRALSGDAVAASPARARPGTRRALPHPTAAARPQPRAMAGRRPLPLGTTQGARWHPDQLEPMGACPRRPDPQPPPLCNPGSPGHRELENGLDPGGPGLRGQPLTLECAVGGGHSEFLNTVQDSEPWGCWSRSEEGWGPGGAGGSSPRDTHTPSRGQSGPPQGSQGVGEERCRPGTWEGGEAGVSREA